MLSTCMWTNNQKNSCALTNVISSALLYPHPTSLSVQKKPSSVYATIDNKWV